MQFTSNNSYNKHYGITSIPKTTVTNLNMMKCKQVKKVVAAAPVPVKVAPKKPAPAPAAAPVKVAPKKRAAAPAAAPVKSVNFEDLNKELDENIKTIKKEEQTVIKQTRNMLPKKKRGCACNRKF